MMEVRSKYLIVRLLPVALLAVAAGFWFVDVQQGGPSAGQWAARNLAPLLALVLLSWLTLYRGAGRWSGAGLTCLTTRHFLIASFASCRCTRLSPEESVSLLAGLRAAMLNVIRAIFQAVEIC